MRLTQLQWRLLCTAALFAILFAVLNAFFITSMYSEDASLQYYKKTAEENGDVVDVLDNERSLPPDTTDRYSSAAASRDAGNSNLYYADAPDVAREEQVQNAEDTHQDEKAQITEQEAVAIAQKFVSGKITDVEIETKFGKTAYVVEIDHNGDETDVIIDIKTGEVLGTET